MRIKSLKIAGYKSIVEAKFTNLNPFTVLVGANASGKSNIFEALEFLNFCSFMDPDEALKYFGGLSEVAPVNPKNEHAIEFDFDMGRISPNLTLFYDQSGKAGRVFQPIGTKHFDVYTSNSGTVSEPHVDYGRTDEFKQLLNFTRLFVGNNKLVKRNLLDDSRLNIDASNLEKVLKRIFRNQNHREEIVEILQALVPGFENLEIKTEALSGTDNLLILGERH